MRRNTVFWIVLAVFIIEGSSAYLLTEVFVPQETIELAFDVTVAHPKNMVES